MQGVQGVQGAVGIGPARPSPKAFGQVQPTMVFEIGGQRLQHPFQRAVAHPATQRWKRLWRAWYGGYRSGRSAHCSSVRAMATSSCGTQPVIGL